MKLSVYQLPMSLLILYFNSLKSLDLNIINLLSHILQIIYLINCNKKVGAPSPTISNFLALIFFHTLLKQYSIPWWGSPAHRVLSPVSEGKRWTAITPASFRGPKTQTRSARLGRPPGGGARTVSSQYLLKVDSCFTAQKMQREEKPPSPFWLLFFNTFFFLLPLSLPCVNWASQEGCLFYLRFSLHHQTFVCSIFAGFSLLCL